MPVAVRLVAASCLLLPACRTTPAPTAPSATDSPASPASPASTPATVPAKTTTQIAIIDRPITFGDGRKQLTVAYRQRHQDPQASDIAITPKVVVLHHTGRGTLEESWGYFEPPTIDNSRPNVTAAGDVNVSAHFMVDRDGTIYRLVPETWMARHCIGLNHVAIGIENVGNDTEFPLTDAQVAANIVLVRHLAQRFAITHVIGHFEYQQMEGHPLFWEREPDYRTQKVDPGPAFMAAVREGIADLELQGPPGSP